MTDEENVKFFLFGLEDSSAGRSDDDDSVFVFLANYATELWYIGRSEGGILAIYIAKKVKSMDTV